MGALGAVGDDGGGRREGRLGDEDRPPAQRLGEQPAQRGPGGGAEHRGGDPQPPRAPTGVHEREGGDEPARAAHGLQRAADQQDGQRVRGGASE